MSIKKTLTNIVLAGALTLALGVAGCGKGNPEYHYDKKIGEEKVKFYEKARRTTNILEIERADGTKVKYVDYWGQDFKLDWVEITKNGETIRYNNNIVGKEVLAEAQKQFDDYLAKILAVKQTKGLDDLSK